MASSTEQTIHKGSLSQSKAEETHIVRSGRADFDAWAAAVREQMLAALQKRSAQS
ncbi:MAG TPA: hypothetical protein V6D29_04300 [Leptolyngbyaceae cyanobacterium]